MDRSFVRGGTWTIGLRWLISARDTTPPGGPRRGRVTVFPGEVCELEGDDAEAFFADLAEKLRRPAPPEPGTVYPAASFPVPGPAERREEG